MELTRVGLVVDALIVACKTATGLQVTDGPIIGELMYEALVVGFTDSPDRPGYELDVSRQDGMGRPRLRENFTVRCLLTLTSGTTDPKPLRDRAVAYLGLIDDALRDEHVSTGVWDRAALTGRFEWIPVQHEGGATVNVLFEVAGSSLL